MEDSFRIRVEKAFGSLDSLSSNTTSSSSMSSLWSLTDEEIKRREWNRDRDSPNDDCDDLGTKPYPSNLDGFFANQRMMPMPSQSRDKPSDSRDELEPDLEEINDGYDDISDNENYKKRSRGVKPADHDDEEWDIRSSVGLDCTLDHEEEEDEYDKVAIGSEKTGDRLYMSDINDYGSDINSFNELPHTFRDVTRDPRANHMAAKMRLKEDAEAAGNFDSLQVSDDTVPCAVDTQDKTSENGINLKSILKKRENHTDSKLQKRVRFDPGCKIEREEESEGAEDLAMETYSMEEASFPSQDSSGVPDYIRNPSKYTHYTFDSSTDIDEESNRVAYMDFLNLLKRPNTMESLLDGTSTELPKSVTFTPKKKPGDAVKVKRGNEFKQNEDFMNKKGLPIIAAGDAQESEVRAMEEDEPEAAANKISSLQRRGRQYRIKANADMDELVT